MILRSAFWLAIGFAIVAPHGTNLGQAAAQLRDQAIASGTEAATQIIVSQVLDTPVARAAVGMLPTSTQPAVHSVQDATPTFVFPRSRPAALG
jgi:hypothetical protein